MGVASTRVPPNMVDVNIGIDVARLGWRVKAGDHLDARLDQWADDWQLVVRWTRGNRAIDRTHRPHVPNGRDYARRQHRRRHR
jgi:hypothetical protein